MNKSRLALPVLFLLGVSGLSQQQSDIRDVNINTETAQGQLIQQAGQTEDVAQKIKLLETFVRKYSDDSAINYVRLQLQGFHLQQENYEKSIEYGEKLLDVAPNDLEIRHNLTKAYEGAQAWDKLLPHLLETKPMAEKEASLPKPGDDAYEEEIAMWKSETDYARGVVQYIEYSLYTSALKINDPATKAKYLEALVKHYPEGQYAAPGVTHLALAYQQAADYVKMADAMEQALEYDPNNEEFLYTVAEGRLSQQQTESAKQHAQRLLEVMETKAKPENMTEEEWQKRKELFTAYGNFVMGKALVVEAGDRNLDKFREGRRYLLQAVDALREQGGQNYGALAYFLGICYVKLDIGGDNIDAALRWMDTAGRIEGPFQAQARKIASDIRNSL